MNDGPAGSGSMLGGATGAGAGPDGAGEPTDLTRLAAVVAELHARVDLDGQEIDALQVALGRAKTTWWREPSLIVSVLALVLAGVASWLSQADNAQEAADAKRQQLASNVQRINSLERESQDLANRSPELAGLASGAFSADYALLAVQSADLIAEIPDRANPTEYLVVCRALYNTGNSLRSRGLCEEGLRRTNNINEAVAGMRQMGYITAMAGDTVAAQNWYQQAITTPDDSSKYGVILSDTQKNLINQYTEIFWQDIEAQRNNCPARREHLAKARASLLRVPNYTAYTTNVILLENAEKAAKAACP